MGGRSSRPKTQHIYEAPDPLFQDLGCIGMTRNDYSFENRLTSAPFHHVKLSARSFYDLRRQIITYLGGSDPSYALNVPVPVFENKPNILYGPVYMLNAYDKEKNSIECFLYFPNISKDGEKWTNFYQQGIYHRWIYRLLFNPMYKVTPYSSCSIRLAAAPPVREPTQPPPSKNNVSTATANTTYRLPLPKGTDGQMERKGKNIFTYKQGEPRTLMHGCRTDKTEYCKQNDNIHKQMGIWTKEKKGAHYPSVYFRVYKINIRDVRLKGRIVVTADSPDSIVRNILPMGLDMYVGCASMMVSKNGLFVLPLGNTRFGIYMNKTPVLCSNDNKLPIIARSFPGFYGSRMIIEEGALNIYSAANQSAEEGIVFSMNIVPIEFEAPYAVVLEDDGSLSVYDRLNTKAVLIDAYGNMNPTLTGDTSGKDLFGKGKNGSWNDSYGTGVFDTVEDYRQRLLNLKLYLRLLNKYVYEQTGINPEDFDLPLPSSITNAIPFDASIDYAERYVALLEYLGLNVTIDIAAVQAYYVKALFNGNLRATKAVKSMQAQTPADSSTAGNIGVDSVSSPQPKGEFSTQEEQTPEDSLAKANEAEEARKKKQEELQTSIQNMESAVEDGEIDIASETLPPAPDIYIARPPNPPAVGEDTSMMVWSQPSSSEPSSGIRSVDPTASRQPGGYSLQPPRTYADTGDSWDTRKDKINRLDSLYGMFGSRYEVGGVDSIGTRTNTGMSSWDSTEEYNRRISELANTQTNGRS